MPEFVSAVENGRVITVTKALAKSAGLKVVDQPATDRNGRPLPPRPVEKAPVKEKASATEAAKKSTGGAAASKPEEAS